MTAGTGEQTQGQQVSMEAVTGWYSHEVGGLMARLLRAEFQVQQLSDENNQLRAELRQGRPDGADPGSFAPPATVDPV